MTRSSKLVSFAYTGFPYLAEEIPPLFEQRDDFIFESGHVIALPQGTDVPSRQHNFGGTSFIHHKYYRAKSETLSSSQSM